MNIFRNLDYTILVRDPYNNNNSNQILVPKFRIHILDSQ